MKLPAGAQPGSLTRTLTATTFVKSYSCLTNDIFVTTVSVSDSMSRSASGVHDTNISSNTEELVAIEQFLQNSIAKTTTLYLDDDGEKGDSCCGSIVVITRDNIFSAAKSSGVTPPSKPPI